ncbi:hypothetical protein JOF56_007113 [Kibdelosporangium banguiense]|uniref:DUF4082 domain-containing protein n=1 Tax=Kibdelosporangium banguiense TaxID=1365924 RepID=A0ABS4TQP5_9PSEU|nr:DUF4082 domain-containing protein [Kibdelosporangium banguiense]MBP2326728.1 hypothetical protein [Kibdelosporangium banguiense]
MFRLLRWTAVLAVLTLAVFGAPAAMASTAPWHVVYSPSVGARAEVGEPVLITGYSYIGEGTPADSVELTFDGGVTWAEADIYWNGSWRYLFTPTQPGDIAFNMRGWYKGQLGDVSPPRTLHVGTPGSLAPVVCPCNFREYEAPRNEIDPLPVELGVRFAVDRPSWLYGVTFQRGTYRGPVTIRVWGPGGTLLHEQDEPASTTGYTSVTIAPSVPLQPGADYVVSYYTPEGGYQASENYYTGTLFHAPFIVRADAGVYHYGEGGGFPTDTWYQSNYTIYPAVMA